MTNGGSGPRSGQDLGDGVWPVLAALLPRASLLQVPVSSLSSSGPNNPFITEFCLPSPLVCLTAGPKQVAYRSNENVYLVVRDAGIYMALSSGLGLEGAQRLADLLITSLPCATLVELFLRCPSSPTNRACCWGEEE